MTGSTFSSGGSAPWQRPRAAAARRALLLALALAPAGVPGACSEAPAEQRASRLEEGRAKLAKDPSAALFIARDELAARGDDPQVLLLAATACLRLDRRSEALQFADRGLALDDLDDDLAADLHFARGAALMGRFRELNAPDDWRAANSSLERATAAGSRRADAATLLVGLQDLGTLGSTERQLKFARLLFELEPDGEAAVKVRALLESKGLPP